MGRTLVHVLRRAAARAPGAPLSGSELPPGVLDNVDTGETQRTCNDVAEWVVGT